MSGASNRKGMINPALVRLGRLGRLAGPWNSAANLLAPHASGPGRPVLSRRCVPGHEVGRAHRAEVAVTALQDPVAECGPLAAVHRRDEDGLRFVLAGDAR